MMIQKTVELLEKLMTGYEMTSSDLNDLLRDKTPEGLFLEYKDGKELEKPRSERNGTIREYLSAFANSAGGILIIGVDENTWTVTGCPAPGGGDLAEWEKKSRSNLAEWAARCVTPIAYHFSPRPRYQTLDHPDGQVLIMVTERSPNLIPCNVEGEFVYYLRHHDQTLKAPEYLITDLLVGRRQHPYLHITNFHLNMFNRKLDNQSNAMGLSFYPVLICENQSLAWAESVRLGIVSWVNMPLDHNDSLSSHLLSHVEVQDIETQNYSGFCDLAHKITKVSNMEPFDIVRVHNFPQAIPLGIHNHRYTPYTWKAAAYILSKGSPPIWYQLTLQVDTLLLQLVDKENSLTCESDLLNIKRLSSERPIVAWDGLHVF